MADSDPGIEGHARALLVDFGSTFTKVRAVDLERAKVLGGAQAPSTVRTSMMEGLDRALELLADDLGVDDFDDFHKLASSSAAGGLRIVSIGLIRSLTAEAARRAALGAGGKVVADFANGLTTGDLRELERLEPDIIVLAGGTDGGNRDCILGNARALATTELRCPVIIAGNRNAQDEVAEILAGGGLRTEVVENVLPDLDRLEIDGCSAEIRRIFMERIVASKGLDDAQGFIGQILMPTPRAVLVGCELMALGPHGEGGLGELICVDVGGATTDVYSVASGAPEGEKTALRGLPEPFVKRTVEGDLGMRINATSILEVAGEAELNSGFDTGIDMVTATRRLVDQTDRLPGTVADQELDYALGRAAVKVALRRHAGTVEVAFGPNGPFSVQVGKDLRKISNVIATGGVFSANPDRTDRMLRGAIYDPLAPEHLVPERITPRVDRDYALFAIGLLGSVAPEVAYKIGLTCLGRIEPELVETL